MSERDVLLELVKEKVKAIWRELEVEERLCVFNTESFTRDLLGNLKVPLASLVTELFRLNIVQEKYYTFPSVELKVDGETARFGPRSANAGEQLEKMLRILSELESRRYVEITLSYTDESAKLAVIVNDFSADIPAERLSLVRYKSLVRFNDGKKMILFMLGGNEGMAKLMQVELESDLREIYSVESWKTSNFLMNCNYPMDTSMAARERITAVFDHFNEDDKSQYERDDEWDEGLYCAAHFNKKILSRDIDKDILLLKQLAVEIKDLKGSMSLEAVFSAVDPLAFGVLRLTGDENGIFAMAAVI